MSDIEHFRKAVETYLAAKKRGRERTWTTFASRLGFSREHVSRVLHGQVPVPDGFAQRVVQELAGWQCIETRDQARALLALLHAPDFLPEDWSARPLAGLRDHQDEHPTGSESSPHRHPLAHPGPPMEHAEATPFYDSARSVVHEADIPAPRPAIGSLHGRTASSSRSLRQGNGSSFSDHTHPDPPPESTTPGTSVNRSRAPDNLSLVGIFPVEDTTALALDINVRNIGTQVAILTHIQIDILDAVEFYYCHDGLGHTRTFLQESATYDLQLSPRLKGQSILLRVSHQIKAGEGDRLVLLCVGHDTNNMDPVYVWYALRVTLCYNERARLTAPQILLLSMPPVNLTTKNVWATGEDVCLQQNRDALSQLAALPNTCRSDSVATTIELILDA